MRLLLACIALFLAPAAALILTEGQVSEIESEFLKDAQSHVTYLNRIAEFYPPNVRKVRDAAAIQQLKGMTSSGALVAANVCATVDSPYRRLFDGLSARCSQWTLFGRARRAALFSVLLTVAAVAVVLVSRIIVTRAVARREWPGDWSYGFTLRAVPALILAQLAISSVTYTILLQTVTGKAIYALAILALPVAALFWLERRLALAFVEPQVLAALRPKRSAPARKLPVSKYIVR